MLKKRAQEDIEPLLLPSEKAAALCGVSEECWLSLDSSGKVPMPMILSERKLWRRYELADWIDAGCPSREQWRFQRVNELPLTINELSLSKRTERILNMLRIKTVGDFLALTRQQLYRVPSCGLVTITEIEEKQEELRQRIGCRKR